MSFTTDLQAFTKKAGANADLVVSVGEINPAGTRCLYDLHVRG